MNLLERLIQTKEDWNREDAYLEELAANRDPLYVPDPAALRLYVVVRDDILPGINQGIQAAHAIVELRESLKWGSSSESAYRDWAVNWKTLILLGGDADDILRCIRRAKRRHLEYAEFQEPDLGNLTTAVAFQPMKADRAKDIFFELRSAR